MTQNAVPRSWPASMYGILGMLCLLSSVGVAWSLRAFFHDDAYIALRYARNLVQGTGLVWNPGERVEGYTSLAWVLLCAGLSRLGLDLEAAARVLGLASYASLLAFLVWRGGPQGLITSALLATSGAVIAWSLGGLETVAFACLLTICALETDRFVRRLRGAPAGLNARAALPLGLLFGGLEILRPEGTLFLGVTLALILWSNNRALTARPALVCLAGFAVIFAPRILWRIHYYGDVLPNTFYVKTPTDLRGIQDGLLYLGRSATAFPGVLLLAALSLARRRSRLRLSCTALPIGCYLAYLVLIGGDHMPWFRMVVPIVPTLLYSLVGRVFSTATKTKATLILLLAACILNLLSTAAFALRDGGVWRRRDSAAQGGRIIGLYIRESWPQDCLVALNTAGSTPYYAQRNCIDMLGLNDRHIARRKATPPAELTWTRLPGHARGDGAYVLSREPDFIILGGSEGYTVPWFLSDYEIINDPRFEREYVARQVGIRERPGGPLTLFTFFQRQEPTAH